MLYRLLKPIVTLVIKIYFKQIKINDNKFLHHNGPLLLACNHPNSFLDAILLCILFKKPVYALTRGDTFKKKSIAKILYNLYMLPIYREREGVENLHLNYNTFNKCLEIFKKNGIVLIFSEALCINEWHLRPIKKGTAKLAFLAWEQSIPLQILPVGLNYSSFNKTGKIIHINFGNLINNTANILDNRIVSEVTKNIYHQLSGLVYEIDKKNILLLKQYFDSPIPFLKKILLFLPATLGFLLHLPIYYPLSLLIYKKAKNSGHYDSIMIAVTFISYPVFILGYTILSYVLFNAYWILMMPLLLPILAWCYMQIKKSI